MMIMDVAGTKIKHCFALDPDAEFDIGCEVSLLSLFSLLGCMVGIRSCGSIEGVEELGIKLGPLPDIDRAVLNNLES